MSEPVLNILWILPNPSENESISCSVMSDLCDTIACRSPGSSVHRILQATMLEWIAIPFSRRSSPPRAQTQVSHIAGRIFNIWAPRESLMRQLLFLSCPLYVEKGESQRDGSMCPNLHSHELGQSLNPGCPVSSSMLSATPFHSYIN